MGAENDRVGGSRSAVGGAADAADAADATDAALVLRARAGDGEAIESLVRRYVRPVHAVIASFLSEPADIEDAAQDAFLRALATLDRFDPARPFAPWLYQIARNVGRNRIASRMRWQMEALPKPEGVSPEPGPDAQAEAGEIRRLVTAAMRRLPEQQRTAFRLSDVDGYGTEEVARIMGLTRGTVRSHVHHARRALRAALKGTVGEADTPGRTER